MAVIHKVFADLYMTIKVLTQYLNYGNGNSSPGTVGITGKFRNKTCVRSENSQTS